MKIKNWKNCTTNVKRNYRLHLLKLKPLLLRLRHHHRNQSSSLHRNSVRSIIIFRHSFYQTDGVVTIQIPIKGLKKDQVQLQTTDTTVCLFPFDKAELMKEDIYLASCGNENSFVRHRLFARHRSRLSNRLDTHNIQCDRLERNLSSSSRQQRLSPSHTRCVVDRNQAAQTTSCSVVIVRCEISRRKNSTTW